MVNHTQKRRPHAARPRLPDLYISCDVEADGSIPGRHSMVSAGLCCAGWFDGRRFVRLDPRANMIYRELKPISKRWMPAALDVTGLTREYLKANGQPPEEAMPEIAAWVRDKARGFNPWFIADPVGYDWKWLDLYLLRYGGKPGKIDNNPFSYDRHVDLRTVYATKAGLPFGWATDETMPKHLLSNSPHTHRADDDCIEQAEKFCNIMEWPGRATFPWARRFLRTIAWGRGRGPRERE
jgi:hypothetical protein